MPYSYSDLFFFSCVLLFLSAIVHTWGFREFRKLNRIISYYKQIGLTAADEKNRALLASKRLNQIILESLNFQDVVQRIADTIPNELFFGTGVVSLIDEKNKVIRRVAASRTKEAVEAIKALEKINIPFTQIAIPINDKNNIMSLALLKGKVLFTENVYDVMRPALNQEQSQKIQQIMGTNTTLVYPIFGSKSRPIGIFLASTRRERSELSDYELEMIKNFVDGVGIAMEHALIYEQLKDVSKKLEDSNKKLQELDQLKDDFVSVASHELRTPMTAIKSYLWLALNRGDVKLSEKMNKYLTRGYISTERLINLVNDMLNVSRIEAGRIDIIPKVIDLGYLMEDIVTEIRPRAEERSITITIIKSQIPRVFADPDKVYQIVLNLLGNAVKFTPSGGTISVSFFSDGKMVETAVKDSGVGISQEDISRLFQKFSRLDNSYVAAATSGGTGLGLFISKSLVEIMHGKIGAKSEGVGKGSTFFFTLPAATPEVLKNAAAFTVQVEGEAKKLEPTAF